MESKQKIHNILRTILKEYSADQRLPFDNDKFKNKNYFEQYMDWLEDFGKYGTLPPSKLKFWTEVRTAIEHILKNKLHGRFDFGLEDKDPEEIMNEFARIVGRNLILTDDNKIYVERNVVIGGTASDYDMSEKGKDPKYLFNTLVSNYQNNVGGCWSYKHGGAESYCSTNSGDSIIMKGYIRTDDIDFVKTVLLNFHYKSEHEIRVKPNAKIELFEVSFNCKYKLPLKSHLIVNATYFGNNAGYSGDYATIDDGFGNLSFIDRKGNKVSYENMVKAMNDKLIKGVPPEDLFQETYTLENGLIKVVFFDRYSFIGHDKRLTSDGKVWFDYVDNFYNSFSRVRSGNKWSYVNSDGKLIGDGNLWFDNVDYFSDSFAIVTLDGKYSLINANGELFEHGNVWFDNINKTSLSIFLVNLNNKFSFIGKDFKLIENGLWFDEITSINNIYARVKLDNKYSFVDRRGKLMWDGKRWFDYAFGFIEGYAAVEVNDKWTFIDAEGEFIKDGNLWFDSVSSFRNGFAIVDNGTYLSFMNKNGDFIGGGLWFDDVEQFRNGIAKVIFKGKKYYIDYNGNFYDYETKKKLDNMNIKNESLSSLSNILIDSINEFINEGKSLIPKSFMNSLNNFQVEYDKASKYMDNDFPMLDISTGTENFYKIEGMSIENDIWKYKIIYDDYNHTTYEENIELVLYDEDYKEYFFNEEAKMFLSELKKDLKKGIKYFKEYSPSYDDNETIRDEFLERL